MLENAHQSINIRFDLGIYLFDGVVLGLSGGAGSSLGLAPGAVQRPQTRDFLRAGAARQQFRIRNIKETF